MNASAQLPLPVTAEKTGAVSSISRGLGDRIGALVGLVSISATPGSTSTSESSSGKEPPDLGSSSSPPINSPSFAFTEADVLEQVNSHLCYREPDIAQDVEVRDLPVFDDITEYGEATEGQPQLWAKEVARLVESVTNNKPLEFLGSAKLDVDSSKSHELLATVADLVYQALNIVSFDGDCVYAEYDKEAASALFSDRSYLNLQYLRNDDEDTSSDYDVRVLHGHRHDIFAFVDFTTAIMARIVREQAERKSMAVSTLAHLAKISTKIKVVSTNLLEFARISLDHSAQFSGAVGTDENPGRFDNARPPAVASTNHEGREGREGLTGFSGNLGEEEVRSKKDALRSVYMRQCSMTRGWIVEVLFHIVFRLRGISKLTRTSFNRYEISAIVYETGFERFNTLVFQDQNHNFSGTAEPLVIRCASTVLQILDSTARHIQTREQRLAASNGIHDPDPQSVGAQITWSYFVDKGDACHFPEETTTHLSRLPLRTMNNVVSILIPLIFANPALVNQTSAFLTLTAGINAIILAKDTDDVVLPRNSHRISASFCLDTEEYRAAQRSRGPKAPRSLSNSFIRQNGLLAGEKVAKIGRTSSFPFAALAMKPTQNKMPKFANVATLAASSAAASQEKSGEEAFMSVDRIRKRQQELDAASSKMQGWVLEEKGVMVKCRAYVSTVMLICVLLVAGGIAVGVTVGDRIPGVDPFNVTTYCWVLAAFVVLVAKSARVHEWPWNDFLYGRVLCKSVSELSSVTGIHEQLIVAYLLQHEETSFLETRGPFNAVFRRRSEDGFSIDRPLSLWTLLLSGLIMIEGRSLKGLELVCLDLRRGTHFDSVPFGAELKGFRDDKMDERQGGVRVLSCELLKERTVGPSGGSPQARLVRGRKSVMEPFKASGIYGNADTRFV